MSRAVLLCVAAVLGCALAVEQPQTFQKQLWKLWGHGVNARTPFTPAKNTAWKADIPSAGSCHFASWSIPFDSLTSYGPFAIHPVDGRVFVGVICDTLPYIWIIPNAGGRGTLVKLSRTACYQSFPYASDSFEGYFNFLPDGSLVFGLCGNLTTYNTTSGAITSQPTTWPAVVLGVANTNPPQLLWSGGLRHSWWTDWGMSSVSLSPNGAINASNAVNVQDSTVMWGVNGTTMYNGHFNQWAPNAPYGLQYWKTPITATSRAYVTIPECGETRPWTFATDTAGSVYSSLCTGSALAKYDNAGNSIWNITAFEDNTSPATVFLSDDEQYVYAGDVQYSFYVVATATGDIVKRINISQVVMEGGACNTTIYGPFAARWPVPLAGSHKFLTLCQSGIMGTTLATLDPVTGRASNIVATNKGFSVFSVFLDGANNAYVIGTTEVGNKIHVERWLPSTI